MERCRLTSEGPVDTTAIHTCSSEVSHSPDSWPKPINSRAIRVFKGRELRRARKAKRERARVPSREHDPHFYITSVEAHLIPRRDHAAFIIEVVTRGLVKRDLHVAALGGDAPRAVPLEVVRSPVMEVDGLPPRIIARIESSAIRLRGGEGVSYAGDGTQSGAHLKLVRPHPAKDGKCQLSFFHGSTWKGNQSHRS